MMNTSILELPFPVCVIDKHRKILQKNDFFNKIFDDTISYLDELTDDMGFNSVVNDFANLGELFFKTNLKYRDNVYYVYLIRADEETLVFFINVTDIYMESRQMQKAVFDMALEMFTPLTLIRGYAELLRNSLISKLSGDKLEYFNQIINSSTDLSRYLNTIIAVLTLSEENITLEIKNIELKTLIRDMVRRFDYMIQGRNLNIILEMPDHPVFIKGDSGKLSQALINILDNSVKYTGQNGEIMISIEDAGNSVNITIEDSGIGVPDDEVDKIFKKFYRVDNDINKNISGSGLGLYVAKLFINLHKGNIWIEESSRLSGLCVKIMLPKEMSHGS